MDEYKLREYQMYVLRILSRVDTKQASRFEKLQFPANQIAIKGILRHFDAWRRVAPTEDQLIAKIDTAAIREIIDDAIRGVIVYAHSGNDLAQDFGSAKSKNHRNR